MKTRRRVRPTFLRHFLAPNKLFHTFLTKRKPPSFPLPCIKYQNNVLASEKPPVQQEPPLRGISIVGNSFIITPPVKNISYENTARSIDTPCNAILQIYPWLEWLFVLSLFYVVSLEKVQSFFIFLLSKKVPATGFEPATLPLVWGCSDLPELRRIIKRFQQDSNLHQ